MPVFIAYDERNFPVSVVKARSLDLAEAFWQGKGLYPNFSVNVDTERCLEDHTTGVIPLVSTHRDQKLGASTYQVLVDKR